MTPIDYKALADRLKAHAECHSNVKPFDDEQRQWADDLRTVATMLGGMADQELVGWFITNGIEVPLYPHPAPQPQPTERSTVSDLERICAESYQVVGWLADECGLFDNESVIKALDNLSEQRLVHEDVLPFAPVERRRREQEGAAEMTEADILQIARAKGDETDTGFIFNKEGPWSVLAFARALLADRDEREAALRAEVERLKAAIDMQPSPPTREDMDWAGKVFLAEAEKENDALRAEVEALRRTATDRAGIIDSVREWTRGVVNDNWALRAEVEALRADAERFRWLCDQELPDWMDLYHQHPYRLRERIDAAMALAKDAEAR